MSAFSYTPSSLKAFLVSPVKLVASLSNSDLIDTYLRNRDESVLSSNTSRQDSKNLIIDLEATMGLMGVDKASVLEMLELLSHSIQEENYLLQEAYQKNDISSTRALLHKLKGSLSYCSASKLQKVTEELHEAVRKSEQLSSLEHLYQSFYQEIENFIDELDKIKSSA